MLVTFWSRLLKKKKQGITRVIHSTMNICIISNIWQSSSSSCWCPNNWHCYFHAASVSNSFPCKEYQLSTVQYILSAGLQMSFMVLFGEMISGPQDIFFVSVLLSWPLGQTGNKADCVTLYLAPLGTIKSCVAYHQLTLNSLPFSVAIGEKPEHPNCSSSGNQSFYQFSTVSSYY